MTQDLILKFCLFFVVVFFLQNSKTLTSDNDQI